MCALCEDHAFSLLLFTHSLILCDNISSGFCVYPHVLYKLAAHIRAAPYHPRLTYIYFTNTYTLYIHLHALYTAAQSCMILAIL